MITGGLFSEIRLVYMADICPVVKDRVRSDFRVIGLGFRIMVMRVS